MTKEQLERLKNNPAFKEQTTKNSFENAWSHVKGAGLNFTDMNNAVSFTEEKRILMLKRMVAYFETNELYERCAYLMKLLSVFGVKYFNTESYR